MSGSDATQVDQVDLFSQALFMLDEVNKDVEVCSSEHCLLKTLIKITLHYMLGTTSLE